MVDRIKLMCEKQKISIKQLERELGFGNGTIRRWDENKPSAARIAAVADYFNVSISWLMGDSVLSDVLLLTAIDNGLLTDDQLQLMMRMDDDSKFRKEAEREAEIADKTSMVMGKKNKKSPAHDGAELTPIQAEAWELIKSMDDNSLQLFIRMAKGALGL